MLERTLLGPEKKLSVLQKKLLTLGCVIGILACGACFGPGYKPPPPPSLRVDLHGIRTVDVVVTNDSQTRHLDAGQVADSAVQVINTFSRDTGVKASIAQAGVNKDAQLTISIVRERVEETLPSPEPDTLRWKVHVWLSVKLTARDGREIWSRDGEEYSLSERANGENQDDVWARLPQPWSFRQMNYNLIHAMFYGY